MQHVLLALLSAFPLTGIAPARSPGPPAGRVAAAEGPVLAPGARGELSLTVRDAAARDLPLLVRLWSDTGIELVENRLDWRDVVDRAAEQPRITVPIRAGSEPGTREVRATVTYWLCDELRCLQRRGTATWTVRVAAAAP